MKFGKLQDLSNINFSLPPNLKENKRIFEKLDTKTAQLYIGCTGWSMKEWVGRVYPNGTKTKDYLVQYAKQFNTIELNTTHYRIPNQSTIEKWYKESTSDFKFSPKIPQSISHKQDLGINEGLISMFCESIVGLKEKLGCSFMQLPPYFGPDKLLLLRLFLEHFPKEIPLAIEFRDARWFSDDLILTELSELLEQHDKAMVITDVAGRRDVLHNRLTNHIAMIRFVGNGLVDSDFARMDEWLNKLKYWIENGVSEVYFFTHEPDNLLAPEAADYFARNAKDIINAEFRGPNLKDGNEGKQISLF